MNNDTTVSQKQPYVTPTLVVKGTIAELTLAPVIKAFGASDGFILENQPIHNAS